MKLLVSILLAAFGVLLMFSDRMWLGLGVCAAAWWIYERTPGWRSSDDALETVLGVGAVIGALATVAKYLSQ